MNEYETAMFLLDMKWGCEWVDLQLETDYEEERKMFKQLRYRHERRCDKRFRNID